MAQSILIPLKATLDRLGVRFTHFGMLAVFLGSLMGIIVVQFENPYLFLLILAGLVIFTIAVFSVEFGLIALVILSYTRFSDIVVHNYDAPSVAKFFIGLLVLTILLRWIIFHETPKGWQRPAILIGIYGLVGFTSLLYAHDPSRVLSTLETFIKDAIIAVIIVILLQRKEEFRHVIWTLIFIGIFLGTLSVIQYATGTYTNNYGGFATARIMSIVGDSNDYRAAGPIGDPNYYAQIMVVLVPLALERVLHERRILLRSLAAWGLLASLFAVVLTYSRGGFLALAAALAVFLMNYPPKLYQTPGIVFALAFLVVLTPPQYFERLLTLNQFTQTPGSLRTEDLALRGRASENLAAWEMIKDHPFFGVGLSNYGVLFAEYSKRIGLAITTEERAAHDLYLEVTAETGFVGLFFFLLIIFVSVRSVFRAQRKFKLTHQDEYTGMITAFGSGLIGYLVAALFIHAAFPRYFYLLIGLAMSLHLVAQNMFAEPHKNGKVERITPSIRKM